MAIVPVIVPYYRAPEKLEKCLAAIRAQAGVVCEAFVRDNSADNILYTAAINEGLARYCSRDDVAYVLLLNQDAYPRADCVRRLVDFMDAHPQCGIASPVQESSGAVTWAGSLQALPFGVHRTEPVGEDAAPYETHWANGACMMVRAETVRDCGRLDPNMRFIYSDVDFSFTARSRGWKAFVVPGARCEHSLGASRSTRHAALELVKCRDTIYFADKWLAGGLYRALAFEGAAIDGSKVAGWLAELRERADTIEAKLVEATRRP